MRFTYDLNTNGCLILYADAMDQVCIAEMIEAHGCDKCERCEHDALESLISNSELEWIQPEEIGALTSAPILGIRGEESEVPEDFKDPYNLLRITAVMPDGKRFYEPVESAWAFMDYQVRSFLDDLLTEGKAVFVS